MRIGVFGGSFDPVHSGHLALADACLRQARLDRVLLVPTARQPLKPHGPGASDADRLDMLRAAIADRSEFEISTLELDRGGTSYTVDTLRELAGRHPDDELFLLMGEDSLADFPRWREPEEILRLAKPLVVARPQATPLVTRPQRQHGLAVEWIDMPPMPVASSDVQRRIAAGDQWESMVPPAVAAIIRDRGLYGA